MSNCINCLIKSTATKELSLEQLDKQEENCIEVSFKKKNNIIKQGALSSNIVYLKSGLVKIHIEGPHFEQIIRIVKAPSYLGIPISFSGNKVNEYSATAITDASVCFIDVDVFKKFIICNGDFATNIILELCRNEISSYTRCVNRTQKHLNGRVAEVLLFFRNSIYNSDEFEIPITRQELGNLMDSSREAVSRILSDFNKDGIIKQDKKKISILEIEKLQKISDIG